VPYRRKKLTFAISSPDEFLCLFGTIRRSSTEIALSSLIANNFLRQKCTL